MGFCWGAVVVFEACRSDIFSFGISFHPSLQLLRFLNRELLSFADEVKCPQQYFYTKQEEDYYKPEGALHSLLKSKFGEKFQALDYSDQNHGFMTRGSFQDHLIEERYN